MRDLSELRSELDTLDQELVSLFERRMDIARQVAQYKLANGMPVLDSAREEQVLQSRAAMLEDDRWHEDVITLYRQIMALSRAAQEEVLREAGEHA